MLWKVAALKSALAVKIADPNVAAPKQGYLVVGSYASRRLTTDLARTRFLEGAKAFVEEHGQAFVDRFGTGSSSHAA
ncbi:hypothetical protein [Streptomyces mirabilis]|uniref:hypothetical protein n=1 Tax=Streptomyces mirabilis TaxID=68239 RepID=UPI0033C7FD8A